MNSKEYLIKKPVNGYVAITIIIILCISFGFESIYFASHDNPAVVVCVLGLVVSLFCFRGLNSINPNTAAVMTLFGKYKGSIVQDGLCWINPLMHVRKISLKARSLNVESIKVNDSMGNCLNFVEIQSETAVRSLAGAYSYDNIDEENAGITLRVGGEEVNQVLEKALVDRLRITGVQVIEARINYLAYAPEIAGAMLQRQQATAVVAARQKIVEGAVSMVEMALEQLSSRHIIELDDEKKASMVSNLMVVLTSDKSASPVLNAGTLY